MSILKKPLVTEKVSNLNESGKYGFIVDQKANKVEIKKAVEEMRVSKKTKMLSNWINSETPSLQIAAMKMISEEHEAHRLNGTRQEIKHEGGIKSTLIEWKPAKK